MSETITRDQFEQAADAFYEEPEDPSLNEQGNRRKRLRAAFVAAGFGEAQSGE